MVTPSPSSLTILDAERLGATVLFGSGCRGDVKPHTSFPSDMQATLAVHIDLEPHFLSATDVSSAASEWPALGETPRKIFGAPAQHAFFLCMMRRVLAHTRPWPLPGRDHRRLLSNFSMRRFAALLAGESGFADSGAGGVSGAGAGAGSCSSAVDGPTTSSGSDSGSGSSSGADLDPACGGGRSFSGTGVLLAESTGAGATDPISASALMLGAAWVLGGVGGGVGARLGFAELLAGAEAGAPAGSSWLSTASACLARVPVGLSPSCRFAWDSALAAVPLASSRSCCLMCSTLSANVLRAPRVLRAAPPPPGLRKLPACPPSALASTGFFASLREGSWRMYAHWPLTSSPDQVGPMKEGCSSSAYSTHRRNCSRHSSVADCLIEL
mmetsp:Transcript_60239/g.134224  ORF Transcript_60239/g.134224 Transcript_60239/m.134224 type:complete len:384 (-) Transcript_60239:1446-2597(-)